MGLVLSYIKSYASRLRMAALGYRYDYSRANDEKIISSIWSDMQPLLESTVTKQRRLSRAIAQFRAHLAMRPKTSAWAFEIASLFALPFFLAASWLRYISQGTTQATQSCDGLQLVFSTRWKSNPEIFTIPDPLTQKTVITEPLTVHRLSPQDVALILSLLSLSIRQRTPFPFQLALKCAVDLALVRAAIARHSPEFVLVYWEFSCSLSVITQAMTQGGIETYNVMHGDKHYYAKHAFFEVDRCYCWNDFYADLFQSEHVRAEFHFFTNPSFIFSEQERAYLANHKPVGVGVAAPHMATLVSQDSDQGVAASAFADALNTLSQHTAVTVRTHPFYAKEFATIRAHLSPTVTIQDPASKPARTFLLDHKIIVGTVSTLLLEAAHLGVHVVIISTPVIQDLESYHYLYTMDNVSACTLAALGETIAAIDLRPEVGQTPDTTSQAASSPG